MSNYGKERDEKCIIKVREILEELPEYVNLFFTGRSTNLKPTTQAAYAGDIKNFYEFLSKKMVKRIKDISIEDIDKLKATDIEEYFEHVRLYRTTDNVERTNDVKGIKRKYSTLRSFFSYYFKKDLLNNNPILKVEVPKITYGDAIIKLDYDESEQLLNKTYEGIKNGSAIGRINNEKNRLRNYAIVTLLLGTGIRVSECVGIDIDDIDLKNNELLVYRKGHKVSKVYFNDEVKSALIDYLEERKLVADVWEKDKNALFLSNRKKRITVRSVEIMVKEHAQTVTIKHITPHKLRSTFGTNLYNQTGDLLLTSTALSHSSTQTTSKFYVDGSQRKESLKKINTIRKNDI